MCLESVVHSMAMSTIAKKVFVPEWDAQGMRMVQLQSWEDYLSLPIEKSTGIKRTDKREHRLVAEDMAEGGLDMIIVPGLAFDLQRNRLGHGYGYYDRYLAMMDTLMQQHYHVKPTKSDILAFCTLSP